MKGIVTSRSDNAPPTALAVLAEAGQLLRADSYAALLTEDPAKQAEAYRCIAEGLARAQQGPTAHELLDRAHIALTSIPVTATDTLALARLAASAAAIGHWSLFRAIVEQLDIDPGPQPDALGRPQAEDPRQVLARVLVQLLTSTGEPARIRELMAGTLTEQERSNLAELALGALAERGSAEDIRALVSGTVDREHCPLLADAATRLATLGRTTEASELAADATQQLGNVITPVQRVPVLADLATAYALTGDVTASSTGSHRSGRAGSSIAARRGQFHHQKQEPGDCRSSARGVGLRRAGTRRSSTSLPTCATHPVPTPRLPWRSLSAVTCLRRLTPSRKSAVPLKQRRPIPLLLRSFLAVGISAERSGGRMQRSPYRPMPVLVLWRTRTPSGVFANGWPGWAMQSSLRRSARRFRRPHARCRALGPGLPLGRGPSAGPTLSTR